MAAPRKFFTELPKLKVLSRPEDNRSEVTVYVKGMSQYTIVYQCRFNSYTVPLGFLAQGESPERFEDWLHSHRLLVLSRQHNWGPAALG